MRRSPISAVLAGSGVGLGLGAAFLIAGMAGHAADHAHARQMAEAAQRGYANSQLEAQAAGLRAGRQRYGFHEPADAQILLAQPENNPARDKAKRRTDLECLTQAVYYEARGESPQGQYAVAQVVMNRVKHRAFPQSVCGVVFQGAGRRGCQFSFACDGSLRAHRESEAWTRARRVATRALAGAALADIGSATHFHTTAVSPMWAPQMLRVSQVGTHIFYRFSPHKLRSAPALPGVEHAVLTSGPAGDLPTLSLTPTVETAIEASLEAASPATAAAAKAKPAQPPATPSADSAMLTTPPTVSAGGS